MKERTPKRSCYQWSRWNHSNYVEGGGARVARFRTDNGKSFNLRGLRQEAGSANYEFAYDGEGGSVNRAGKINAPATGTGAQAQRVNARMRGGNAR